MKDNHKLFGDDGQGWPSLHKFSVPTLHTTEIIPDDAKYPSAAATTSRRDTVFLSKVQLLLK